MEWHFAMDEMLPLSGILLSSSTLLVTITKLWQGSIQISNSLTSKAKHKSRKLGNRK
jgi:hypothetical protein